MLLRNVGIHLPSTQQHAPEDRNTQLHRCQQLKTRKTHHVSTVEAGYNDIGLCETWSIASDIVK